MRLVYTPEGAEPREWEFRPSKLMNAEAEAIERYTGWAWSEFQGMFLKGSILALRAVLFVMLKRESPTLKWDQVQFALGEVDVLFDLREQLAMRDAFIEKELAEGLDEDEKNMLKEVSDDILASEQVEVDAPKA